MMKKQWKRVAGFLLAAAMLLPLSACTGGKVPEETGSETEGTTGTPVTPTDACALLTTGELSLQEDLLSGRVTGMDPEFDFGKRITVQRRAAWTLTADADGAEAIRSKKVTLAEGLNRYRITVTNGEEERRMTAEIQYERRCTVSFFANTAEPVPAVTCIPGAAVAEPDAPVRDGYRFLGWYLAGERYDFGSPVEQDTVLVAHWEKMSSDWTYSDSAPHFTDTAAAMVVVWKDYADARGVRPDSVICILTEIDGTKEVSYALTLGADSVDWQGAAPSGAAAAQGAGSWTVKITGLDPGKQYLFRQTELSGAYTTVQNGTTVTNTVSGYVPQVDSTAALTARNARLYDAAGNQVILQGVVTWNVGVDGFETALSAAALAKLRAIGVNCIRLTVQIVGVSGVGYVYKKNPDDTGRTGDCSDATHQRTTENYKRQILEALDYAVENAAANGMYVIVDWGILTSDPNQHLADAQEFFGRVAERYAGNPYVLYEICNEPETGEWAAVKRYAEAVIATIRSKGANGVILVAPNHSATHLSNYSGSDPIHQPLGDDSGFNVAYSFHCYPGNYIYENETYTYGWRVKDAYEAGLTVIVTEFSPMDGTFGTADPLSFDMRETEKYLRLFREYDIGYCYFRYASASSSGAAYHENLMFRPFIDLSVYNWTEADLTACGRWYYRLLSGDGVLTPPDYGTVPLKVYRKTCAEIGAEFGLKNLFPGFAYEAVPLTDGWFFRTGEREAPADILYTEYCRILLEQLTAVSGDRAVCVADSAVPFGSAQLPKSCGDAMHLTYWYGAKKITLLLTCGEAPTGDGYGLILKLK